MAIIAYPVYPLVGAGAGPTAKVAPIAKFWKRASASFIARKAQKNFTGGRTHAGPMRVRLVPRLVQIQVLST
jgi:hypothetical protein